MCHGALAYGRCFFFFGLFFIILFTSSHMSPTQTGELRAHLATQGENTTVVLSLSLFPALSFHIFSCTCKRFDTLHAQITDSF